MDKETKALEIILTPDPVLNKNTEIIKNPLDPFVQQLAKNMFKTMDKEGEHAIGLSAPQVGVSLRLCVVRLDGIPRTLINPKILKKSNELTVTKELCLSVPGEEFSIIRPKKIILEYIDEFGRMCKIKAKNFLSILLQHEIDHLDGILMSQKYKQQENLRKIYKIK